MVQGKTNRKNWVAVVFMAWSIAVPAKAGSHAEENSGNYRPVAEANPNSRVSGCVVRDMRGEFLDFDLTLGNEAKQYAVKGTTLPNQGLYQSDSSYDGVAVTKRLNDNGLVRVKSLSNGGTEQVFPRKRKVQGMTLAGVDLGGYAVSKMFTGSLDMNNLTAGGKTSSGKLFHNVFTGTYKCTSGNCSFGGYPIRSTTPGSNILLNNDNFINKRMRVSMGFGDLDLNGAIKFTDTTETTTYTDSDGDTDSSTTVTSTRACFVVDVKRKDGSQPNFSGFGEKENEDDKTARNLLAWLQLMSYDLFAR